MKVAMYHEATEHKYGVEILRGLGDRTQVLTGIRGDYLIVAFDEVQVKGWTSGYEHKTPNELMQCILYTNRHLDQLNRMLDSYTETTLLITGRVLPDEYGTACLPYRGRGLVPVTLPHDTDGEVGVTITYQRWDSHLRTLERCMGVRIMECESQRHAAHRLLNLANWWQRPPEEHTSHLGRFKPVSLIRRDNGRPGLVRRVAGELPGVGVGKSLAVEERVRERGQSLADLVGWERKEWMEVRGIGKVIAESVVKQINSPMGG